MNMLQAIFKIYCVIIKHFKVWLKIARLSKDVSKCYVLRSKQDCSLLQSGIYSLSVALFYLYK